MLHSRNSNNTQYFLNKDNLNIAIEKYYYDYINKDFNCEAGECITFKKVHNLVEKYVTLPEVE